MSNPFEAIAETMREVICRIHSPLVSSTVMCSMVFLWYAVGEQVPHLRVTVFQILLHSQSCFACLVFAVPHSSELSEAFGDWSVAMRTCVSRFPFAFSSTALSYDLGFCGASAVVFLLDAPGRDILVQWQTYARSFSTKASANAYKRSKLSLEYVMRLGSNPSHLTISSIATKYCCSSPFGFVSSNRR